MSMKRVIMVINQTTSSPDLCHIEKLLRYLTLCGAENIQYIDQYWSICSLHKPNMQDFF